MVGIFQGADRLGVRGSQFGQFGNQEGDPTARQLLDRGTQLIETELQDEPEVRATVMATIAETYATLGSVEDTERLANSTLEIIKELHGDTPTELTADMLGLLAIARYTEGNYEAAIPLGRQAVQIYDDLYGKFDPRGATTKLFMGIILMESDFDRGHSCGSYRRIRSGFCGFVAHNRKPMLRRLPLRLLVKRSLSVPVESMCRRCSR